MGLTHHNGIAVTGSGYAIGEKDHELYIGPSGVDGLLRFDKGSVSTSGGQLAISTRLSSIVYGGAQFGGLLVSGLASVMTVVSGHCIDIRGHTGGGTASSSGLINWFVFGK